MMKKALFALAISGAMATAQAGVLLSEGFDDVAGLESKGWVLNNASTPAGAIGSWFQGTPTIFGAQNGAINSYAAANFGNAAPGGLVNNWLITPEFSTVFGATISFWLRAGSDPDPIYSDQVAFGVSSGSSALSAFTMGPVFTVGTSAWTRYTATVGKSDGTARFALQYTGNADFLNYVGVDNLFISEVPEPASILMLAAGGLGLVAARRRKRA